MSAIFYDNPKTGALHFRAVSGGGAGRQVTGAYDVPATPELIERHARVYSDYLLARDGKVDAVRAISTESAKDIYIAQLEYSRAQAMTRVEELERFIAAQNKYVAMVEAKLKSAA